MSGRSDSNQGQNAPSRPRIVLGCEEAASRAVNSSQVDDVGNRGVKVAFTIKKNDKKATGHLK